MPPALIIFTDLDGSLLDHHNYSFEAALATLQRLESMRIPVIFNSSKTFAEQVLLRKEMNNQQPFIAENGAAVYMPKTAFPNPPQDSSEFGDYWVKSFCQPREHWLTLINALSAEFTDEFKGFSDASIDEIMQWTGLNKAKAELASQRYYNEPIRWLGSPERAQSFKTALEAQGARVLQGGRFMHVSGSSDKGFAMNWLAEHYKQQQVADSKLPSLALGDSPNDIDMLEAADYAVVIKSPVSSAPTLHGKVEGKTRFHSNAYGPQGWAEGVAAVLRELNIDQTK